MQVQFRLVNCFVAVAIQQDAINITLLLAPNEAKAVAAKLMDAANELQARVHIEGAVS